MEPNNPYQPVPYSQYDYSVDQSKDDDENFLRNIKYGDLLSILGGAKGILSQNCCSFSLEKTSCYLKKLKELNAKRAEKEQQFSKIHRLFHKIFQKILGHGFKTKFERGAALEKSLTEMHKIQTDKEKIKVIENNIQTAKENIKAILEGREDNVVKIKAIASMLNNMNEDEAREIYRDQILFPAEYRMENYVHLKKEFKFHNKSLASIHNIQKDIEPVKKDLEAIKKNIQIAKEKIKAILESSRVNDVVKVQAIVSMLNNMDVDEAREIYRDQLLFPLVYRIPIFDLLKDELKFHNKSLFS